MIQMESGVLFLSRLILNPCSRQVRCELAEPYEMHRTLMRAFPEASGRYGKAREQFNVLFRVDADDNDDRVVVYVQSGVEPNWSFLRTFHHYLPADSGLPNPAFKNVMDSYQNIQNGQILSFALRANPTKRIAKNDDDMKGRRVELAHEEKQMAWLIRKGKSGGFEPVMRKFKERNGEILQVPSINVYREGKQKTEKRFDGCSHKMTHLAVRFEGLLRVTDAHAFRDTLIHGIGTAKAFGFGLLSVAANGR